MSIESFLQGQRIVPVIVIDDAAHAVPLAEALLAGGIGCAEFTLRTPQAIAAIREASFVPGFLAGAGTVLTARDIESVARAGATFSVAPDFDDDVIESAREHAMPHLPGVATPREIHRALGAGMTSMKLFPAEALGGVDFLRSVAGPFPEARFVPSGGVDQFSFEFYLGEPNVLAVSGSWVAPRSLIAAGGFSEIEQRAANAVATINAARTS